jgi:hypothetical protein
VLRAQRTSGANHLRLGYEQARVLTQKPEEPQQDNDRQRNTDHQSRPLWHRPRAGWGGLEARVRCLEDALDEAELSFIGETYAFKNVIRELRQGFRRRFNGTGSFGNGRQCRYLITHPDGVNLHDPSSIRRRAGVDRLN